jgi:hypothetical protein
LSTRLLSLLQIEDTLKHRLSEPDNDHFHDAPRGTAISTMFRRAGKEIVVNSTVPWKSAFAREADPRESFATEDAVDWDDVEDPGRALHARSEDMQRLWAHPTVRAILERQGIRLQESAGL